MADVVIAGIGRTEVGEHWEISLRELAYQAIDAAQVDAQGLRPQALIAGNMLAPQLSSQAHLGALLADYSGLTGIEAFTVEAGSASGGAAVRAGYMAVASGLVDVALVVGVEKMTDTIGAEVETALATGGDSDYESVHGITPTAQAAMIMRRYIHEFQVPRQAFAGIAVTAHANGAANPKAMYQKAITADAYQKASIICDPLNMFDVAPNADGAAALILTRAELIPAGYPHRLIRIAGSSLATDTLALHDRPDPLAFEAARISMERACQKAGMTGLQVDFFEVHDAYSIYAVLALEAAGFAERGSGWKLAQDGAIAMGGTIPISTMGGLKARGNPGGAAGVYQVVEAVLQLRGQAGKNQVPGARHAGVQSLAGAASTAVTHILELI